MDTKHFLHTGRTAARTLIVALFVLLFCQTAAFAQFGGRMGGRFGGPPRDPFGPPRHHEVKLLPIPPGKLPHAGEYLATDSNYYEIVYMPSQTRIYLYDNKLKPLSAKEIHLKATVQLPAESIFRPMAFDFIARPAGSTEQNYIVAVFDNKFLEGKPVSISYEFSELPSRVNPNSTFTPYYGKFSIRSYVAEAKVTDADQPAIVQQRVCPVKGTALDPAKATKVYIEEYPLYLSGGDCVKAVTDAPQQYLQAALYARSNRK